MIEESRLKEIGKFQRTHALKGELNAILSIDPEFFDEGYPAIIASDGIFVPFYVDTIRPKGATTYLIKLEGIDSHEEASELVNEPLYALKDDLKEFYGEEADMMFDDDLIGYAVIDSVLGELGTVEYIDDSTSNVLITVRTPAGEEIFIPFNEAFIEEIDNDSREIHTALPDGLVDLNASGRE